ncbi:hypothetical protein, partial [Escherichia coli]|uniref:hypothetical protein n=1 Tax=Escherichia coli TaxID=562 RepID=UPI001BFBF62A
PVPAGRGARFIRIVKFGIVRYLFPKRAQQVQVIRVGGEMENRDSEKKKNPPKRVKCGCVEDA